MEETWFKPLVVGEHPRVMVVGFAPGRQRLAQRDGFAWSGNRSADFIRGIIGETPCVYTNTVNVYIDRGERFTAAQEARGRRELIELLEWFKPKRIVALGDYAKFVVNEVLMGGAECAPMVFALKHPSWVLRFNQGVDEYKAEVLHAVRGGE